jgi:site-specific DNA-cytosine methylase
MYISITDAIKKLDAKVILVENAPALYTKKGKPVADKIYNIAKENGYSLTLYKTSTIRHGIPQDRRRCFAILWKSKVAPYMNFYNHSYDKFDDYVLSYKPNGINLDHTNTKILSDSYFRFLSYKFCNLDIRQMVKDSNTKSVLQFVNNNKLLDEAIDFFKNDGDVKAYDSALYIKNKLSAGGNIWDSSINIYDNNIGALTGRNMTSVLHPIEDRSLTIGECLYIMSFPIDFELLGGKKNMNHIAQNVPVHTARDIVLEAKKFILGELEFSNSDFVKQNNWKEEIDFESHSEEQIIDLFENQ